jgi:hypothetical protein
MVAIETYSQTVFAACRIVTTIIIVTAKENIKKDSNEILIPLPRPMNYMSIF